MTSTRQDQSHSGQSSRIQANLIAYMRLFADLPGMKMYDGDAFWFLSDRAAPGNAIFRANFPEEEVDERIDDMFAQIGQFIEQIDWMVFPGDQPADLRQCLEARGMPGGPGGNWLWGDLTSMSFPPAFPDKFHIKQVSSDATLAEWVSISEAGFDSDLGCFYDAYARHGYGPGTFSLHYTGYLGDIPVTTGTLLDAGGWASIYDISTPPAFRRMGLGGALTHALMREIRSRGFHDTWIWSSNMAKSLYQKLGFVDTDFGMREHTWRKQG
jgi:ribosomal protein S18 acetylase RimI-like enzyme